MNFTSKVLLSTMTALYLFSSSVMAQKTNPPEETLRSTVTRSASAAAPTNGPAERPPEERIVSASSSLVSVSPHQAGVNQGANDALNAAELQTIETWHPLLRSVYMTQLNERRLARQINQQALVDITHLSSEISREVLSCLCHPGGLEEDFYDIAEDVRGSIWPSQCFLNPCLPDEFSYTASTFENTPLQRVWRDCLRFSADRGSSWGRLFLAKLYLDFPMDVRRPRLDEALHLLESLVANPNAETHGYALAFLSFYATSLFHRKPENERRALAEKYRIRSIISCITSSFLDKPENERRALIEEYRSRPFLSLPWKPFKPRGMIRSILNNDLERSSTDHYFFLASNMIKNANLSERPAAAEAYRMGMDLFLALATEHLAGTTAPVATPASFSAALRFRGVAAQVYEMIDRAIQVLRQRESPSMNGSLSLSSTTTSKSVHP